MRDLLIYYGQQLARLSVAPKGSPRDRATSDVSDALFALVKRTGLEPGQVRTILKITEGGEGLAPGEPFPTRYLDNLVVAFCDAVSDKLPEPWQAIRGGNTRY